MFTKRVTWRNTAFVELCVMFKPLRMASALVSMELIMLKIRAVTLKLEIYEM